MIFYSECHLYKRFIMRHCLQQDIEELQTVVRQNSKVRLIESGFVIDCSDGCILCQKMIH